jgi:hypothetical protein
METAALMNDSNNKMRCSKTIHPDESIASKFLMRASGRGFILFKLCENLGLLL